MTANELLEMALKMLGYTEANGNTQLTERIRSRAVVFINLVLADLWVMCGEGDFEPIKALADKIDLPIHVLSNVFLYGLAMFIAQSESDGDQQALWARLYNQKRASVSRSEKVKDVIPGVF